MDSGFNRLKAKLYAGGYGPTDGGCWLWPVSRSNRYGQFTFDGEQMYAHRASWRVHYGPIPDGMFVCHHCDNPPCFCPDHLFLGDAKTNARDAAAKGRWSTSPRKWVKKVNIREWEREQLENMK